MCCEFDFDLIFLAVMTIVSCVVIAINLKILETLFEEYFTSENLMGQATFQSCYKIQLQMRIALECQAIYCSFISTFLMGALAINLPDDALDKMAKILINISSIIYGPIMFTLCLYGFYNIEQLSKVCGISGIHSHQNNKCIYKLSILYSDFRINFNFFD